MSPEERELLQKSVALAEENNNILRSIKRGMRWARIMSYIYWFFIIGSAVGAYYIIQPYLEQLMYAYSGAKSSIGDGSGFQAVLNSLKQVSK
ncbi:MAG TPA: hypothetical protein VJC13_02330 [Candidatus Paceibacterota bacterium]